MVLRARGCEARRKSQVRLLREDLIPDGRVLWIEPALELPSLAVVEDAHHARLHIDTGTPRAHGAQRADMLVVAEDVVLGEPEAPCPSFGEPRHESLTSPNLTRHGVRSGHVPDNIVGDKGGKRGLIVSP